MEEYLKKKKTPIAIAIEKKKPGIQIIVDDPNFFNPSKKGQIIYKN